MNSLKTFKCQKFQPEGLGGKINDLGITVNTLYNNILGYKQNIAVMRISLNISLVIEDLRFNKILQSI